MLMTRQIPVLLVEDDVQIPRVLRHPMNAAGFDMHHADTLEAGLAAIAAIKPELVLLDLGLGERDGKDLIVAVREWSDVPILVLSARDSEEEKVLALDAGADDYVNKPFGVRELFARMRAALRRRSRRLQGETQIVLGDLAIDFAARRVAMAGTMLSLTKREYDVLRVLAQHAGQVVTHKQLLEGAWGDANSRDSQHVRVVVGQLRRKLEAEPGRRPLILTEQGVGYRMSEEE
jgi:two-component system, OmpR family, KDP operon response regulator KdpE